MCLLAHSEDDIWENKGGLCIYETENPLIYYVCLSHDPADNFYNRCHVYHGSEAGRRDAADVSVYYFCYSGISDLLDLPCGFSAVAEIAGSGQKY